MGRGAPWGSRRDVGRVSRTHPHPSRLRRATFPLGGGRLAGGPVYRPYGPHPPRFAQHLPLKGKACGRLIAAPTGWDGSFKAGDRKGRPYGFLMAYLALDRRVRVPYGEHRSCLPFRRERSQTDPPITDQPSPARQSQARLWNRIRRNFRTARPQWAGLN